MARRPPRGPFAGRRRRRSASGPTRVGYYSGPADLDDPASAGPTRVGYYSGPAHLDVPPAAPIGRSGTGALGGGGAGADQVGAGAGVLAAGAGAGLTAAGAATTSADGAVPVGGIGSPGTAGPGASTTTAPPGPPPPAPSVPPRVRPRRRRTRGQRIIRWTVVIVAVILVLAAGEAAYVWHVLGQTKSQPCPTCTAVTSGPYNVLIVGSDSRAGDTGAAAKSFGTSSQVAGQRSDTIKILHVNPAAGTADVLSIPRDTYVQLSDVPASSGLSTDNKINSAFNNGPAPLVATIQNTLGIPISHFVIIDFDGVIDLVNAVGGITLDFRYPVRDNDDGNNNSGLRITHAGCQTLNGTMALALSRSRYYEYEVQPGVWEYDPTGDLGRIQRQNAIIEAVIDKAKSSYNPLTVNSFLGSLVQDITKDDAMSTGDIVSLAERYHAFSGSSLKTYTLPTVGASSNAGDVEVVEQPQANQVIKQFMGTAPGQVTTPPLDAYGSPVTVPPTTTPPTGSSGAGATGSTGSGPSSTTPTTVPGQGPFNPTPC